MPINAHIILFRGLRKQNYLNGSFLSNFNNTLYKFLLLELKRNAPFFEMHVIIFQRVQIVARYMKSSEVCINYVRHSLPII